MEVLCKVKDVLETVFLEMVNHSREADGDRLGKFQDFVEKGGSSFVLGIIFELVRVELSDVGVRLSRYSLTLGNALDSTPVTKNIRAGA
jgi:hypothetical protein